jgi:hypothetical protein
VKRILGRVPWGRLGAVLAVVTLAYSQVFFSLILENKSYFPRSGGFHAWVVIWTQLLPFLVLFAIDTLAALRGGEEGRVLRLWRTALYALAAFSFTRQLQVHHAGFFYGLFPWWAAPVICVLAAAGFGFLSIRQPRRTDRFVSLLGVLALLLTGQYARGAPRDDAPARAPADPGTAALEGRPAVVLLFDELGLDILLKDGRIDREDFPRLAALADEGAWFPDATSNASYTEESVPTILTGRLRPKGDEPQIFERLRGSHRAVIQVPWPPVAQRIRRSGERVTGLDDQVRCRVDARALQLGPLETLTFLRTALLHSPLVRSGFLSPLEEVLPPPDLWDLWEARDVLTVEVDMFLRLLAEEAGRGRLVYWHCSLPHSPYQYDRNGRRHGRRDTAFVPGKYDMDAVWANYREQARGVDRLVGLVVDRLKAMGLYEETLILVTSDHGPRTGPVGEPAGYPDVQSGVMARIPFIARGPSIRPGLRETDYQHVDFAPTLLDLLGGRAEPGAFDGRSAFNPGPDPAPREKAYLHAGGDYVRERAGGLWRRR